MLSCLGTVTDLLDVHKKPSCMNTALLSERMAPRHLHARMRELGERVGLGATARG